jgi:hypothetical protein
MSAVALAQRPDVRMLLIAFFRFDRDGDVRRARRWLQRLLRAGVDLVCEREALRMILWQFH